MPRIFWTTEQAREAGRKSQLLRKERKLIKTDALPAENIPPATDRFLLDRLASVRAQLKRIDAKILAEDDAAKLDRLAAAAYKLSEQEFALAGRPKPGMYRPVATKPKRVIASLPEVETAPEHNL